jgi:hypothetical protein
MIAGAADESRIPIGALLLEKGAVSEAQLDAALAEQRTTTAAPLGEILVRRGFTSAALVEEALAEQGARARKPRGRRRLEGRLHRYRDRSADEPDERARRLDARRAALDELEAGLDERERELAARGRRLEESGMDPAREAMIDELFRHVDEWRELAARHERARVAAENELREARAAPTVPEEPAPDHHLLFVPRAGGYELRRADGPPPEPGTPVDLGADGAFVVVKAGPSPLPLDPTPCVFLEPDYFGSGSSL